MLKTLGMYENTFNLSFVVPSSPYILCEMYVNHRKDLNTEKIADADAYICTVFSVCTQFSSCICNPCGTYNLYKSRNLAENETSYT
jgi:hypothetical protein